MNKKQISTPIFLACFISSIAMAAEPSSEQIKACETYLNHPSEQTENANALVVCYENYSCEKNSVLSHVPNCKNKLDKWHSLYTLPKVATPASTPVDSVPPKKMTTPVVEPSLVTMPATTPTTPTTPASKKSNKSAPQINW